MASIFHEPLGSFGALAEHWVLLLVGAVVALSVLDFIIYKYKERKFGATPFAENHSDGTFGFNLFLTILKKKNEGTVIDFTQDRFILLNRDTLNFRILGKSLYSTRDPENIKAMLATQFNDFALGSRHRQFFPLLGDGIFTLDGNGWKHSRAMLRPQFAREQVAHVKSLEPHIHNFAEQVRYHKGAKFDIQELFFRLTLDSATEFLFGESVNSLKDEKITSPEELAKLDFNGKKGFAEAFNRSQQYLSVRSLAQTWYFLFNSKEFKADCASVHKFSDHYVQKVLKASQDEIDEKDKEGYTFLYELVKETRNPKILRDQLLNILLAGRDTTAGLLSFTFFELSRRPEVWAKLKDEIYQNFGSGEDVQTESISFESLKRCEYLKALINEILRLYPSVPQNFRYCVKDTTLPRGGGPDGQSPIFVPKGKTVIYAVGAMHRDPKYYGEDAAEFRPERWLTGETKKLGWAFLPFNGGPRICLGQQFALTEASYVIARLAQLFPDIKSFDSEYPPLKASHLTMSHQNGVYIGLS